MNFYFMASVGKESALWSANSCKFLAELGLQELVLCQTLATY